MHNKHRHMNTWIHKYIKDESKAEEFASNYFKVLMVKISL